MNKLKMHSPNLTHDNIARIRELFPACVTEAHGNDGQLSLAVDFDQLRQELSESIVEGPEERYHLNWPGKREALLTANAPIAKTLRPCREESVDFDTTKNLFIEGDNLEALKLLQETYLGKVKMIYIDPPYNTGNDFIYEDDFAENAEEFLKRSNQKDEEGNRLVANTEANGRFHSDWLSMIYPRLKLARNLLRDDGVIFISIDDGEQANLKRICDEVFGSDAFVGLFPWRSRTAKADVPYGVSNDVEWVVSYAKSAFVAGRLGERNYYKSDDFADRWRLQDLTTNKTATERPNSFFTMVNPKNRDEHPASQTRTWSVTKDTFQEYYEKGKIVFPGDYDFLNIKKPAFRVFEAEDKAKAMARYGVDVVRMAISTYLPDDEVGRTEHGSKEIRDIFERQFFPYPKPIGLIKFFVSSLCDSNALILDFFAGSATTAHAVMQLNAEDGGNRKFIMVQLPEPCDEKSEAFKAGYKTIAEISKERIRRAGKKIKEENATTSPDLDIGFRVLKIDTSNMNDVYYNPDAISQDLLEHTNVFYMREFYLLYRDDKRVQPLVAQIGWTHNLVIFQRCKDPLEREFYIRMTRKFGWSKNVLIHQIENQSYEKSLLGQTNFDKALTPELRAQAKLAVKDEYTFDFLELGGEHSERELERALIARIEDFLRAMGGMFTFMGSQYRLEVEGEEFFIDLLLFHRRLRCMVAIELKIGKFEPEFVGKMQFYLAALDRQVRQKNENPSIGIILCKEKKRTVVEYALHDARKPIGVATYEIIKTLPKELKGQLPSPQEIAALLEGIDA